MSRAVLFLRSLLFAALVVAVTIPWSLLCFLCAPFPYRMRYRVTVCWNIFVIWLAKVLCGIRYQVKGMENLPDTPLILLAKHQSAWETIFLAYRMPRPVVYVMKRELIRIPLFGWALALLRMIPIDRRNGKDAFAQVVRQGRKRLQDGLWIVMFPEGTRTPVGGQGKYKGGGARLAIETQTPVVPVALNAGECWPRNAFIKQPGLVTISIGKPISPQGLSAGELLQQVENWIESEMRVISPHAYPADATKKP